MNRARVLTVVVMLLLATLAWWVASNTFWDTEQIPTPLQGEAARDPFHAARLFVRQLGATPVGGQLLDTGNARDVIVLSRWNWNISTPRRLQLQRWVESGGRLVVDESLRTSGSDFERWSGLRLEYVEPEQPEQDAEAERAPCIQLRQVGESPLRDEPTSTYHLCNFDERDVIRADRLVAWGLRGEHGLNAARLPVGQGSVTLVRGQPFTGEQMLRGNHPGILVAAAQLRGGDRVHFLVESRHPSLLALTWMYGAPVVAMAAALLALALWRNGTRFGSPLGLAPTARRSLAEQIRGTGQFALRFGGGMALQRATRRALLEAAAARIPGFAALPEAARIGAIAGVARVDETRLASALDASARPGRELLTSIALLESTRRAILSHTGSSSHAT
jgi:hypothetical protein